MSRWRAATAGVKRRGIAIGSELKTVQSCVVRSKLGSVLIDVHRMAWFDEAVSRLSRR